MNGQRPVLVVEDEESVRDLLVRWLEASGYLVEPARNADEALSRLADRQAAVALCDIRMPGQDGLWLASCIRERYPETAIIMSTGVNDVEASLESMRQGVVDYLTKPFGRDRLRDAVARAVEWHQTAWDARRWREALEGEMDVLKKKLHGALRQFEVTSEDALDALLAWVLRSSRDGCAHAHRVADLALRTARVLGLDDGQLPTLRRAALVHDLGKAAIPDALLRKPAPLTAEERDLVRSAPQIAADVLAEVPYLADTAPIVRDVHERPDGQGYPRGLRAASVPVEARIINVANAFDTLTHARVYRDAISPAEALVAIERGAGSRFDPAVARAFVAAIGG